MWYADMDAVHYRDGGDTFDLSFFLPEWSLALRQILSVPQSDLYLGYDAWVQQYPREAEIGFVRDIIDSLLENPRPVHIAGLSCRESLELVSRYYRMVGYENPDTQYFSLLPETLLTVSLSLRHLLWCEKDKFFLNKKDCGGVPYYAISPPLRLPSDLRCLQQAARSGIILGISISPGDEIYLAQVFEKQILTAFQLSQLVLFRWKKFGFGGRELNFSFSFPDFSETY